MRENGLVRVVTREGKMAPKIYVKCYKFSKKGKKFEFYKDGYTDFRGIFDYASLNSGGFDGIDKFYILVKNENLGAKILKTRPPSTIG